MLEKLRRHATSRVLVFLAALFTPAAQALEIGALSLATMPANTMSSVTFSRAPVAFTAFARGVGGVAFTTKAASADGSSIDRLRYDRAALEGSRLIAEIRSPDGSVGHYIVEAPDWIHIPLARFVASGSDGAVTLFGTLKDQSAQEKLEEENDVMIVNYHPALQDTLLGLRLLQADMLAFEENATDLFRDKGQYILGAQEGAPSAEELKTNAESFRRVNAWVERQPERYSSYVLGDVDSNVRYSITGNKLKLVGEPVWYCWRYDNEKVDAVIAQHSSLLSADAFLLFSISQFKERFETEYETLARAANQASEDGIANPLLLMYQARLRALEGWAQSIVDRPVRSGDHLTLVSKQDLSSALASGDEEALQSQFDNAISLEEEDPQKAERLRAEIKSILPEIRAAISEIPFVQMTDYSNQLTKLISSERGINPTVFRALQTSVRVAAFMRAAKEANPQAFSEFVSSLAGVTPSVANPPGYKLTTPTVYPRQR